MPKNRKTGIIVDFGDMLVSLTADITCVVYHRTYQNLGQSTFVLTTAGL